jgi:type IV pilus assembly protein PilB
LIATKNDKFFDILLEKGLLTTEDLLMLNKVYKGDSFSIFERLCQGFRGGVVSKSDLGKIWGDSIGSPFVELEKTIFQTEVVQQLPEKFSRENHVIPIYQFGDTVTLATAKPQDFRVLTKVETLINKKVSPVFALQDEIEDAIEIHYQSSEILESISNDLANKNGINEFLKYGRDVSSAQLKEFAGTESVVQLARSLLLFGIRENASDIHIEPFETHVQVRFRIDGVLQLKLNIEKSIHVPLISRLKILAKLDITERRKPQDGRISFSLTNRSIDFRFSTVPTIHGEKVVLRILGQVVEQAIPNLEDMGFSLENLHLVKELIKTPNGVIFVTGPTGSGKTTTLFSALKQLNKIGKNILTIEDPVEYKLPGVNQVQVNSHIGLDFTTALRSFLRQDPDVILLGEVRDVETAKIASQAALTGHLVLTTMHTNNSFQAVTRLVEIGVEPFLVAPSVIGVLAQRLVRRLCEICKEKYALNPEEIETHFIWDGEKEVHFYRAKGCRECNQTGYKGRVAIQEIFILDEKMRSLIAKNASILDIQKLAMENGFKNLRYDGIKKILQGLTTIDEVDAFTEKRIEMLDC